MGSEICIRDRLVRILIDPQSRFSKLRRQLTQGTFVLGILSILNIGNAHASNVPEILDKPYFQRLTESAETADVFGDLTVQSRMGRMKTVDTLSREILRKLSGKDRIYGLTSNQVVLGMMTQQRLWQQVPLIKVKNPTIRKELGLS